MSGLATNALTDTELVIARYVATKYLMGEGNTFLEILMGVYAQNKTAPSLMTVDRVIQTARFITRTAVNIQAVDSTCLN